MIAGEALGARAVIDTRTPISLFHVRLAPGARVEAPLPREHAAYAYVFSGAALVAGRAVAEGQLAILGAGDSIELASEGRAELLVLSGVPLNEPVVQYGPFVMTSEREIREAILDYQAGRFAPIVR